LHVDALADAAGLERRSLPPDLDAAIEMQLHSPL
jgi:hypothetical protein